MNRILLAYPGSTAALKASEFALNVLRRDGGELAMLAVIRPSEFAVDVGAQGLIEGGCAVLTAEMERLCRRVHFAGFTCTLAIRIGCPPVEIQRMARAWRADLIVTAQPKCFSLTRFFAGRVIRQIRAAAPCNVHVVQY